MDNIKARAKQLEAANNELIAGLGQANGAYAATHRPGAIGEFGWVFWSVIILVCLAVGGVALT
jgi:hypothetical protein